MIETEMYLPKTHMEELLLATLIAAAVYGKSFPTRTSGYTAHIERHPGGCWNEDGQLEAALIIKPDVSDEEIPSPSGAESLPIFLSVEVSEASEGTEFPDRVTIWWDMPVNLWLNWRSLSERWPVIPGPFLRKPEERA